MSDTESRNGMVEDSWVSDRTNECDWRTPRSKTGAKAARSADFRLANPPAKSVGVSVAFEGIPARVAA